ncbi:MAG: PEP-CTERM sorting domain-containing protein [Armatimonadota bacterium]
MMKRLLILLLPLALVPATGAGQRFFDDFDGEDLGEHWGEGNPKGGMIYSVHDSLLDVERLEGIFSAREWIKARIPEFEDFDMRARVGWTHAPPRQSLMVMLDDGWPNSGSYVAQMTYQHGFADGQEYNLLQASFSGGPFHEAGAPRDGFHEFRITRNAGVFTAYFDGEVFLTGSGTEVRPQYLTLYFSGLNGQDVDLFVDRVSVVPEPLSALVLAMGMGALALRRRRTR